MLRQRTTPQKTLGYNARQRLHFLHVLLRMELRCKGISFDDPDSIRRHEERLYTIRRRIDNYRS